MACSASHADISVFSLDGTDFLGAARQATITLIPENRDASVLGDRRDHSTAGTKRLRIEADLLSQVSAGVFHDDRSVSEFTITSGAGSWTTPINYLESISLNVQASTSDHQAFGAEWAEPCQDSYSLTGTIEMRVPKGVAALQSYIEDLAGDTSEAEITVSIVPYSGGPDYNLVFTVSEVRHELSRGAQIVTITLGDHFTVNTPSGSSDLASHIVMAENVAFSVETEGTYGMVYTAATAIPTAVTMNFSKGQLQTYNVTLESVGAPTVSDQQA